MSKLNRVLSAGILSDRYGRSALIVGGVVVVILADIVLALAPGFWVVLAGVALWGLYMGMTQGVLSAMVADTAPNRLRGTAFGFLNLVSGLAMVLASVIAGLQWDTCGGSAPIIASALFATSALVAWLLYACRSA